MSLFSDFNLFNDLVVAARLICRMNRFFPLFSDDARFKQHVFHAAITGKAQGSGIEGAFVTDSL